MKNLPLNIDYSGKVVVVTGAGGLICGAMARAFARSGAKVAALDLNEEAVKKLADERLAQGDTNGFYAKSQFHSEDESRETIFTLPIVDENSNSCVGYIVVSSSKIDIKSSSLMSSTILNLTLFIFLVLLILGSCFPKW